jgi:peptide/nickel transport system permease protein
MTDLATAGISPEPVAASAPARTHTLRQLLKRRTFVIGATGLIIIILIALFSPILAPHDPLKQDLANSLAPPFWAVGGSFDYPLGTDTLGRDVASRLMYGARNSLVIAFFAVLLASVLGLAAGLSAGFSRGWWDSVLMRFGDIQLAFPFILLAITILGITSDRNAVTLILVIGIPTWIIYARVVRSRVLVERDKDYVLGAKAIGASRMRQLRKYILPSVWTAVLVIAMLDFGYVILLESTLSFLGFGLTPPTPSWGSILAEGKRNLLIAPWLAIFPGLAIMGTVLAINLTADGAADVLDPKMKISLFHRLPQRTPANGSLTEPERKDAGSIRPKQSDPKDELELPTILKVRDLSVEFPLEDKVVKAVRHVSFDVHRGRTLGIVGESGSGKSVSASSIIQLIEPPGTVTSGEILFEGRDLTRISNDDMTQLRGTKIGMIYQNPTSSLNPVLSIGSQMVETIQLHMKCPTGEARDIASQALHSVGIGNPQTILSRYPFQLSGGMNQRVMISLAMLTQPDLLIADEPSSALDVTTQAVVLERLRKITREHQTSLILITHDIALVAEFADEVLVMYAGQVCEVGPIRSVIDEASHPYTRALLQSVPRAEIESGTRLQAIPGELPDPAALPPGCPFADRCVSMMDICRQVNPRQVRVGPHHEVACHLWSSNKNEEKV